MFSHLALYILHTHSFHPFLLVVFSLPSLLPVLIFPLTYDRAPPKMPSTRSFLTFSLLALFSPLLISAIPQGYEYPAPPPANPNPASPYTHPSLPPGSYIPNPLPESEIYGPPPTNAYIPKPPTLSPCPHENRHPNPENYVPSVANEYPSSLPFPPQEGYALTPPADSQTYALPPPPSNPEPYSPPPLYSAPPIHSPP